jgi:internalin A
MAASQDQGFIIEDGPKGRTLTVTGPWSSRAEEALYRPDVVRLALNYTRGFSGDLEFLDAWPISRLHILDRSLVDLYPVTRLGETLEELDIQTAPDVQIDLGALSRLRRLSTHWDNISETLSYASGLEHLEVWQFDGEDIADLDLEAPLTRLKLVDTPNLLSLDGIEAFSELTFFFVALARELDDLDAIPAVADNLKELEIETCLGVTAIDAVGALENLRFLGVSDCGRIDSLSPLANLTELEVLYAWGSTRVLDGDLTPLLKLPRLREIRMRDRREYKPRIRDIPSSTLFAGGD